MSCFAHAQAESALPSVPGAPLWFPETPHYARPPKQKENAAVLHLLECAQRTRCSPVPSRTLNLLELPQWPSWHCWAAQAGAMLRVSASSPTHEFAIVYHFDASSTWASGGRAAKSP